MKQYKVIYHIGDSIGLKTKVSKGKLWVDGSSVFIQTKDQKIQLDGIRSVALFMLNGLGSMLNVKYGETTTIFIAVVRFCVGQFATGNFFGTRELKGDLEAATK